MKLTRCLLCDSENLVLAVKLADMPLPDAYSREPKAARLYPTELNLCQDCGHAQLGHVVDPKEIWVDYLYRSGDSPSYVKHLEQEADEIVRRFHPRNVLEVGSNDGAFLKILQDRGVKALGVDPSHIERIQGTETIEGFFSPELAYDIVKTYGTFDCVVINHAFAHTTDMGGMIDGVKRCLEDGVFVFEVASLRDLIEGVQYDQIYHEHISYHSIAPLQRFFERHALELFDAQKNKIRGGSLRGFVRRIPSYRVFNLWSEEGYANLKDPETYSVLTERIEAQKKALPEGKLIGFGASSSVTSVIYNLGLQDRLEFLVDDNSRRHGLYSPGANLPVKSPQEADGPVVILALKFAEQIAKKTGAMKLP